MRREREKRESTGNGRLSIGVAKSNVVAPPRKLVAEKASAIYKSLFLFRLYNPGQVKGFFRKVLVQDINLERGQPSSLIK